MSRAHVQQNVTKNFCSVAQLGYHYTNPGSPMVILVIDSYHFFLFDIFTFASAFTGYYQPLK